MNWKRLALAFVAAIVVLVAAFAGGLSLYSDHLYRDSYESHYSYQLSFASNQSLENVTVYAPIPVESDDVRVVDSNVTTRSWDETTPDDAPPVDATIVQTEHGPMLALTVDSFPVETHYYRFVEEDGLGERVEISEDEFEPGNPEMVAYTERSVEVDVTIQADHSIDTRNPTGTEPLLSPEFDRAVAPCDLAHFETQQCYDVESRAFVSYEAPAETRSSVWVEFEGRNEWWIFGWNGNSYSERYSTEFHGPQDDWHVLDGILETGWGNYRGDPPAANRSA